MSVSRRTFLRGTTATLAACGLPAWVVAALHTDNDLNPLGRKLFLPMEAESSPATRTADVSAEVHLLNRITYGVTSTELERLRLVGIPAYLDEQLHPDAIDDSAIAAEIGAFSTLAMDGQTLLTQKPQQVRGELTAATVLRAISSRRQLQEIMVNFWSDHFNISINKGQCKFYKTLDDRDVIRPHALGTFRDLLGASARSPAMLVFLDNRLNKAGAANENYGREVMELHTLGVDGGYSEADVENVARCFTGWTIRRGAFVFAPKLHDTTAKTVLGNEIAAGGGIEDGERVLDILATHPSTARFIAGKLCRRLVSDDASAELIASVASIFVRSEGGIREMLWAIFGSDEFKAAAGKKLRRPADYVYALVRSSGATVDAKALGQRIAMMGQMIYGDPTPRGYPDDAESWMTTDGMLGRWNFAFDFAAGKLRGTHIADFLTNDASPADVVLWITERFFPGGLATETQVYLMQLLSDGPDKPAMPERTRAAVALMMAAPVSQWH